jgi:FAD/FMN-containing dehydrogenase
LTLGMTFVDGRGCIVSSGGRVVKNVAGFDLTSALIGSWGTLGCIVSASLRLRALPAVHEVWAAPTGAVNRELLGAYTRGPYAPFACETVPAAVASEMGLGSEAHVVLWLAGSAIHVAAARDALKSTAPVREVSMSVWDRIRSRGPFGKPATREPLSAALVQLNARVRSVFDPHEIFVSPVMSSDRGFAGV